MAFKTNELTPKKAIKWVSDLRKLSEKRGGEPSTKYEIRIMFNYIVKIMQYQEVMPPIVEEDGRFICPRCNEAMIAESGTADDYKFCPLCGQRWKEDEDGEEDNIC